MGLQWTGVSTHCVEPKGGMALAPMRWAVTQLGCQQQNLLKGEQLSAIPWPPQGSKLFPDLSGLIPKQLHLVPTDPGT